MSIKALFKYLNNKVYKSSLECSCVVMQPRRSPGAVGCQVGGEDSLRGIMAIGLQCELKLTLRSAPHNDLQKTADKRGYFEAGQRGG